MALGSKHLITQTFTAASDMSASSAQFILVTLVSAGNVAPVTAVTQRPIGVLQNSPEQGEEAVVAVSGFTKLRVSSASLAANSLVGTDTAGRAVALTAGTSTGYYVCGITLDNGSPQGSSGDNAGSLVSALISCVNPPRNA